MMPTRFYAVCSRISIAPSRSGVSPLSMISLSLSVFKARDSAAFRTLARLCRLTVHKHLRTLTKRNSDQPGANPQLEPERRQCYIFDLVSDVLEIYMAQPQEVQAARCCGVRAGRESPTPQIRFRMHIVPSLTRESNCSHAEP